MKKNIILFVTIFSIIILLIINPFTKSHQVNGIVSKVYEGGIKDLVIELENHQNAYYINRGLEEKSDSKMKGEFLIGENISITYLDRWTLLDPFSKGAKSIETITKDTVILYNK